MKWAYKLNLRPSGDIAKYKTGLVTKDFLQRPVIDFNEVYTPVARVKTTRIVVAIATYKRWKMHQLDVKSTFLDGSLENIEYM